MRLGFLVDAKGRVPVKVVARTFASGIPTQEKLLFRTSKADDKLFG